MRVSFVSFLVYATIVASSSPYAPAHVQCVNDLKVRPASEVRTPFLVGSIAVKLDLDSVPSCPRPSLCNSPFTSPGPDDRH
jgi:lysophospholipase